MPGPTWQNRFFIHSGTCLGHLLMPSRQEPQNMRLYYQETIYDRLSDANIDWKIYHDGIPQSIVMTRLLTRYLTWRGYADMDDFFDAAAGNADDFPAYSFIEPSYFGVNENDQHPPADVRQGEMLLAQVYNALRANPALWESTLFVVTYDEHGGFYDHVPPPATVAPDDHTADYAFDRLGVRVPTILISPWIDAQVIPTVFDHTSLLRYLCEKWNLPPLGKRMQESAGPLRANTFGPELTLRSTPRQDTPEKLTVPVIKAALKAVEPPIEGAREALLQFIDQLPAPTATPATPAAPEALKAARGRRPAKGKAAATPKRKTPSKAAPAFTVEALEGKLAALRQPKP
jgi:phospholipase C